MNLTVGLKFTKIMKQIDIYPYFYPELNLFLVKNQEITWKIEVKVLKIANCQIDILNEIVNKLSNLGYKRLRKIKEKNRRYLLTRHWNIHWFLVIPQIA